MTNTNSPVRLAIIGAGAVSDYHHVPGIRLDPRAELVGVCDADAELLEKRRTEWGIDQSTTDPGRAVPIPDIDAVIIATPNFTHRPIAVAAAQAGKHIMCEKPLGPERRRGPRNVRRRPRRRRRPHDGVHLPLRPVDAVLEASAQVGRPGAPRHFRSQRFLDWPETSWGWRQYKDKAGAGDLFDMTIHRIDFAHRPDGSIDTRLRRRRPVRPADPDPRRRSRARRRTSTIGRA